MLHTSVARFQLTHPTLSLPHSAAPAIPTAAATASLSAEQALDDTIARLSANRAGVPFGCATCVAIGPGGAGKTSARRAIQGHRASTARISTVGGERDSLAVVQLQHGATSASFAAASQLNLTNVQRGLIEGAERVRAGSTADTGAGAALNDHVDGVDAFTHADALRREYDEREAALTAMKAELHSPQKRGVAATTAAVPAVSPKKAAASREAKAEAVPPSLTTPHNTTKPTFKPVAAQPLASLPEQIHAEQGVLLSALAERKGMDVSEIVRVIFYDMGGQPEFWPLVGEFIRRCVSGGLDWGVDAWSWW